MRLILIAALIAAATPVASAPSAPPRPITTFQVQPVNRLLTGVRQLFTRLGDAKTAQKFEAGMLKDLGPKGLAGLNLDRPVTGYQVVNAKSEGLSFVVLVPVTSKEAALDLFKRGEASYEPTPGDANLYALKDAGSELDSVLLRFVGQTAYFGISVPPGELDPAKLPSAASLTLPNEGSWLAVVTHLDRVRPEDRKKLVDEWVKSGDTPARPQLPQEVKDNADIEKFFRKYAMLQYEEGKAATYRVDLDPRTLELSLDYQLTPRPGTPLAASVAARKPSTNRFAAVVGEDCVAGVLAQLPLFDAELRDGFSTALENFADPKKWGSTPGGTNLTGGENELAAELLRGLARAGKAGQVDLAAAVRGPDARGTYTAAAALSFGDAAKLDAELHRLAPGMRPEVRDRLRLDVYKAEGVAVHQITVADALPPGLTKIWGDGATVCVGLTKTGVVATFGGDSLADIKRLIKASETPGPAGVFELRANPRRARAFAKVLGDDQLEQFLPTDAKDETRSLLKLSLAGGGTLDVKLSADLGVIRWPADAPVPPR